MFRHRIFKPKEWKNIDWTTVYHQRNRYRGNFFGVVHVFTNPFKQMFDFFRDLNGWLVTIAIVFKYTLDIMWWHYAMLLPALWAFFLVTELLSWRYGKDGRVLRFFNRRRQIDREKNDTEMEKLIAQVGEIHNKMFKEE